MGDAAIEHNPGGERQTDRLGQDETGRSQKTNASRPNILDHCPADIFVKQQTRDHQPRGNAAAL